MENRAWAGAASEGCQLGGDTGKSTPPDTKIQESPKPTYAPVPARALADTGLSALDLRVLATIAAHDRFSKNGAGCYASHLTLARLVKCHLKSLSRCLKALGTHGYITARPHPLTNKRMYCVLYTDADKVALKSPEGNETVTHEGNELVTDDRPEGNEIVPFKAPGGNRRGYPKEITRSVEEITRSVKESSAEAAPAMKEGVTTRTRAREAVPAVDVDDWRHEADDPSNPENW